MKLTAPYIWIMTSGVYDVLQIWDQDGSVSYFDIYVNGDKIYTLEKDDDIVYITISDLCLEGMFEDSGAYNIGVIGYNDSGDPTENSNIVCWYGDGQYNNNGADPDIINPFKDNKSVFYFYLDSKLVDTVIIDSAFNDIITTEVNAEFSTNISSLDSRVVIITMNDLTNGTRDNHSYIYDYPLESVSVSPDDDYTSVAANMFHLRIYATSGPTKYMYKRIPAIDSCENQGDLVFRHYGTHCPTGCIVFTSYIPGEFSLSASNIEWDGVLEYSTDTIEWNVWDGSSICSANEKLYLRGYNNTTFYSSNGVRFSLSIPARCHGNLNTLLQYDNPPIVLSANCYYNMFKDCINLVTAPALPATTLSSYCYYNMFSGCINLVTAPALPATIVDSRCYSNMFSGCINLTQIPAIHSRYFGSYSCDNMFEGCEKIMLSENQTDEYTQEYKIPFDGNIERYVQTSFEAMFKNTGGSYTGDSDNKYNILPDTIYYLHKSNTIITAY